MILLWIVLGAMTLAAAIILAWPLFDARRFKNDATFALAVYRDQLAEINHDAARGILDETQARAAQIEIERRILALDDAPKFQPARAPRPALIVAMAVILPLAAFGLYLRLGHPALPGAPGALYLAVRQLCCQATLLGQQVRRSRRRRHSRGARVWNGAGLTRRMAP